MRGLACLFLLHLTRGSECFVPSRPTSPPPVKTAVVRPQGVWNITHTNDVWLRKAPGPFHVEITNDHFYIRPGLFGKIAIKNDRPLLVSMMLWNNYLLAKDYLIAPIDPNNLCLWSTDMKTYYYLKKL